VKKDLFDKTSDLQIIASEMRSFLSPDQVGKFLIWVEKKKDKKELEIANIWGFESELEELEEEMESVKLEDPYSNDPNYNQEEISDCIFS